MEEKRAAYFQIRVTEEDHLRYVKSPRQKRLQLTEKVRKLIQALPEPKK